MTKATITLASALPADDIIQVMVMTLTSSIPADANLKVLVTNNANDSSPVWEDATADIKSGVNHVLPTKPPPMVLLSTSSSLLSVEPAIPAAIFLTLEVLLNNGCLL